MNMNRPVIMAQLFSGVCALKTFANYLSCVAVVNFAKRFLSRTYFCRRKQGDSELQPGHLLDKSRYPGGRRRNPLPRPEHQHHRRLQTGTAAGARASVSPATARTAPRRAHHGWKSHTRRRRSGFGGGRCESARHQCRRLRSHRQGNSTSLAYRTIRRQTNSQSVNAWTGQLAE